MTEDDHIEAIRSARRRHPITLADKLLPWFVFVIATLLLTGFASWFFS